MLNVEMEMHQLEFCPYNKLSVFNMLQLDELVYTCKRECLCRVKNLSGKIVVRRLNSWVCEFVD